MCLSIINSRAKKPAKVIGYKVAKDHGNGLYGPLHQNTYMRYRVGLDYNYYRGDGFHVFFKHGDACNYRGGSASSRVILRVECTNIMEVGSDGGRRAFTCEDMKVLAVEEKDPERIVKSYYHDSGPCNELVYWKPSGKKPLLSDKNVQSGFALTTFNYTHKLGKEKDDWTLVLTDAGENLILPTKELWCAQTEYKS